MPRQADGYFYHQELYDGPDTPFKPGVVEMDTMTCAHCMSVVLLNAERKRARGWCWKGDHYLCDPCYGLYKKVGECFTTARTVDLALAHPTENIAIGRGLGGMPTARELELIEKTRIH